MPHKFHNTIRLGRSNRLAVLNLKRLQTAAWIAGFAGVGMLVAAIGLLR